MTMRSLPAVSVDRFQDHLLAVAHRQYFVAGLSPGCRRQQRPPAAMTTNAGAVEENTFSSSSVRD
jgi:hypothetical protein